MDNIVFENICKKAYDEAKKPFVNNKANDDDIIEIVIKNNKPFLINKPLRKKILKRKILRRHPDVWRTRKNAVFKFFIKCCKLLDNKNPINIVLNIGLHDAYNEDLGIMVFSLKHDNQKNILILASFLLVYKIGFVDKNRFIKYAIFIIIPIINHKM